MGWEDGVEVLWGAKASGAWFPGVTWKRSIDRNEGLQAGLPSIFTLWASDAVREVSTGSTSLFSPLGYTTMVPIL